MNIGSSPPTDPTDAQWPDANSDDPNDLGSSLCLLNDEHSLGYRADRSLQ